MNMFISIFIFLCIFSILVISHEGGHFLIAKANGIRVKEFTIGVGPALWQKKVGETNYALRALPFGGACIFDGMDVYDREDDGGDGSGKLKFEVDKADERAFPNAKVWSRIATVIAGPLFNFLLAYLIAVITTIFGVWNYPVVSGFAKVSAAKDAGILQGDRILSMDGKSVHMAYDVTQISFFNEGEPIRIRIERDGARKEITVKPLYSKEDNRYYLGMGIGKQGRVEAKNVLPYAWYTVKGYAEMTFRSLSLLVRGKVGLKSLSGPVGMVQMVDETYQEARPLGIPSVLLTMLDLTLLLSVNLGIMNLLPVPGLDGGRLLFLILEVLRGKPISPEKEGYVTVAGMVALIALMVVVLFNDVGRFFH